MDFEHLSHTYLDEETFTRNQIFWIGNVGLLLGWLTIDSFTDFVTVAGLWILADMILYAYQTDRDLVKMQASQTGGENLP